ncbi:hypothetical protein P5V15_010328 [Pogonomyrmex californicus]
MKSIRSDWRVSLLVLLTVTVAAGTRPETILRDVLARPFVPRENASPECLHDSKIYLKSLETYTPWALKMFDASVKIPSGIITGNYKQLGNFDECLQVKNEHGFVGQACNTAVQFEIAADNGAPRELDLGDLFVNVAIASNASKWTSGTTVTYEWMFCVPSTCNHTEIQEALEFALDPLKVDGRVEITINVTKKSCHTAETVKITWDISDWCYTSILVLFAIIIIASTTYEIAAQRWAITSEKSGILTAFSLYKNGKELMHTERRPGSIRCLDGLRFISIAWIIFGHTYYMETVTVKMNLTHIPYMHYDWMNMLVLNGNIVTDTFFLLSGTLLAYTELRKKERRSSKWRFDVIGLYIHRYIRLTPAYAMMIGFYATLLYKFGTGPHWDTWIGSNRDFCREKWWINLLYLNNYLNVSDMCMSQSWYLATDMQFVWLSPIILYPMLKLKSRFFIIVLTVFLIASVLAPFITTYTLQLMGTMLYYKEQMDLSQVFLEIYIKTYNRFGSYVVGIGLGYVLYKTQSYPVKLRIWSVVLGWIVAIVAGLSVIFGSRNMYFDTYVYNRLEASLYAGLHRQVFAISVSWIIFCCVHGYAGLINHLLSWRGWISLSKLTYCAYLSHFLFILSDAGAVRTSGNLTLMNVTRAFFANLVFTLILSVVWSLCFEMPFINISSIIFGRKRNLSKHLDCSTASAKEICQPKNESSVTSDPVKYDVACCDLETVGEKGENGIKYVSGKVEQSIDKIYIVTPIKCDETCSAVNTNNSTNSYTNVDLYYGIEQHQRINSNEKESESIDIDLVNSSEESKQCLRHN